MPDMRDIPFKTRSMGPSSGQSFRRMGQKGRSFAYAAAEIQALSARFTLLGRAAAEDAVDIIREEVIRYIQPPAGDFHGYSTGRLAATIGRWDPGVMVNSESAIFDEEAAKAWASANGVANQVIDTGEELTIIEYGAYASVKRVRSSTWSAEVGTFTPYAGLVEDGGSMPIAAYGNPNRVIIAHWEAQHMFKKGTFAAYERINENIAGKVKEIMT
jgi:hypothetical protein